MRDPDALLSYMIKLQKLLKESSLNPSIREDNDRYDERIDTEILPGLDFNDKRVARLA